jgi:hypothetical protein
MIKCACMIDLTQERDVETLRQISLLLERANRRLITKTLELTAENESRAIVFGNGARRFRPNRAQSLSDDRRHSFSPDLAPGVSARSETSPTHPLFSRSLITARSLSQWKDGGILAEARAGVLNIRELIRRVQLLQADRQNARDLQVIRKRSASIARGRSSTPRKRRSRWCGARISGRAGAQWAPLAACRQTGFGWA